VWSCVTIFDSVVQLPTSPDLRSLDRANRGVRVTAVCIVLIVAALYPRRATIRGRQPAKQPYTRRDHESIRRIYDEQSRRRDHSRDAAVKHAAKWLLERNVDTVYVGDLTDVLETHWSAEVNEKTHSFWSHRQLVERVTVTFGDVGITVTDVSEYDTSSECPVCSSETIRRDGDLFRCDTCTLEAHADVAGAWNILQREVGPMARPAALSAEHTRDAPTNGAYWQWNDHDWTPTDFGKQSWSLDQPSLIGSCVTLYRYRVAH